jgi:tellurite resistance protein TerC
VIIRSVAHRAIDLHLDVRWWHWAGVGALVVAVLVIDIVVLHRRARTPSARRALAEVLGWVALGVAFGVAVWVGWGSAAGGQWFSGYLIELSLSVDNVFVWAVILAHFAVPRPYQHRVLFWGVFGAILLRAAFVFAGVALVNRFEIVIVLFGVFLIATAARLALSGGQSEADPERNPFLRLVRRLVPSTAELDGHRLFTRVDGGRRATPLFAVLILLETTDVLFAVDSVPAVLAISRTEFLVLTSNAFAILGLRAMYFLLAGLKDRFRFLPIGLSVILAFVGAKMILSHWVDISTPVSLAVIALVLVVSVTASLTLAVPGPPTDR